MLIQLVQLDDPNVQRQEWFPEWQELVSEPALARTIGFTTFFIKCGYLIEQRRTLVHYGNTNFVYHNEFRKYMKVKGTTSEDVFDYLFDVEAEKFLLEKERNIFMNYLKNGI